MIYVDTSVALAYLLVEDRKPPEEFWQQALISSRLLAYEIWCRVHAHGLGPTHGESVRATLMQVSLIELSPTVLARALEPFPLPVRTLDALHLASIEFLRARHLEPSLASYDQRMLRTAREMGIKLFEFD